MTIDLTGTSLSLKEALDKASDNDTIILDDKEYFEKITLSKKNITMIGKENSVINYNASHGTINKETNKPYGTTGSSTFRVLEECISFKASNITFKNSFIRGDKPNGQAVAFKSECNSVLENCKFISAQDTLYLDYAKCTVVNNCYIEGDIDFIFGSANATFNNCKIVSINNDNNIAYVTAPNTLESNNDGFIFNNCEFISNGETLSYLGRPWYPGSYKEMPYPKLSINNSTFKGKFIYEFLTMHEGDPNRHTLILNNNKQN